MDATKAPKWLEMLQHAAHNPLYADQQIIPITNDGTYRAVWEYIATLRAERDAAITALEAAKARVRAVNEFLANQHLRMHRDDATPTEPTT